LQKVPGYWFQVTVQRRAEVKHLDLSLNRGGKLRFATATVGCINITQTLFNLPNRSSTAQSKNQGETLTQRKPIS
jgi:hypothetical protein